MQFRYEVQTTHFHTELQLFAITIDSMFSKSTILGMLILWYTQAIIGD